MPTRRAGFIVVACLLLATGLNACWADTEGSSNGGTAVASRSAVDPKRAAFAARAKQSFAKLVKQKFQKWDQNGDGALSADEIDRLIFDPSVSGLEAAAVAAIHRHLRSEGAPPAVTQAELLTQAQQQPVLPEERKSGEPQRQDVNDGQARFVTYYASFASHIKKAPRDLFAGDDGPTLDGVKQGSLGDCYFMCVIGATVNRDSQTIRRMLHANSDGTTDVKFPAVGIVRVGPLTDGQIALTSSAADQGIWINVLEKAFGEVRFAQPQTKRAEDEIDLDVISRGGKIGNTIQLMTGHKAFDISIRKLKNKKLVPPTGAEIPRISARLDSVFSKAFATNRLVCADRTRSQWKRRSAGFVRSARLRGLGYDQPSQTVTVWNPHGKDYKPKATPAGLRNGYPVKGGVFQLPLSDFVRIFKAVTYETSAPLPSAF